MLWMTDPPDTPTRTVCVRGVSGSLCSHVQPLARIKWTPKPTSDR